MADERHEMGIKQTWPCAHEVYGEEREAGDQWGQTNKEQEQARYLKKCEVKNATGTMGQGWLGRPLKQGYKKGDPRQTDMCSWSWSFGNDRTNGQLDCKREGDGRLGKGP